VNIGMDQIKQHFEEEAHKFDRIIQQLIPYYDEMLRALISAIPFDKDSPIQILDLGCGTGTLAGHLLHAFPRAQVTCLDFSEQMIGMAQAKLAAFDRVSYVVQDFRVYTPEASYHAIVSSLALHHLVTDDENKPSIKKTMKAYCRVAVSTMQMWFWQPVSTCRQHTWNAGRHLCGARSPQMKLKMSGCRNIGRKTSQLNW